MPCSCRFLRFINGILVFIRLPFLPDDDFLVVLLRAFACKLIRRWQ